MRVTQNNFPETIHLGDVTKVKGEDLEKIDLLLGGSPCQGFSFAGKQLNFNDPRSALFFEFVRLLKECNPKYFLLENVRMKKEYQDVITEHLGVEPIMINSALVSAQNRVRLYWTNIPNITQPEDRDIVLKDILENGIATDEMTTSDKKSFCLTARYQGAVAWNSIEKRQRTMVQVGMANDINGHDILKRIYSSEGKAPTLNSMNGGNRQPKIACGALRGRQITPGSKEYTQMLELREDNKTNTLTSVQKDNVLTQDKMYYRKLTPLECERLQTVPDGYTEGVSNTQRYKMLGNGWTVEVIKHVLQNIT
jgi:DNA (cytosine-5)-methyltransferase 3A